jgi:hypothetical protein
MGDWTVLGFHDSITIFMAERIDGLPVGPEEPDEQKNPFIACIQPRAQI